MKKLRLLDSSGDTVIEFDETEAMASARSRAATGATCGVWRT
jgi:hypothetical protein